MGEKEVTTYETVEKTETVPVCDSCGTAADEVPDEAGEFRTLFLDFDVFTRRTGDSTKVRATSPDSGRDAFAHKRVVVHVETEDRDLCPICWGAVFG